MDASLWERRRVLVTGHTGFKGSWLALWLKKMGATVSGFALSPSTKPNHFALLGLDRQMASTIADINDRMKLTAHLEEHEPEVVFHLAAQPLVRLSYDLPVSTFMTNIIGTANLLDAIRSAPCVRAVVVITSDKCYENREWTWGYRENEALGGRDPYSASKGAAEIVAAAMRQSYFSSDDGHPAGVATARAGNVIGGGDWCRDRLVPDIVRGCLGPDGTVLIRNPDAVRPWQHVLEPLSGYLLLAERLLDRSTDACGAWNFGPGSEDNRKVIEVAEAIVVALGKGRIVLAEDASKVHEANLLRLDISKAQHQLGWQPILAWDQMIRMTADWYSFWHRGRDVAALTHSQIDEFVACMNSKARKNLDRPRLSEWQ